MNHHEARAAEPSVAHLEGKTERDHPRGSVKTWALCLLLAATSVASVSLAVWAMRSEKQTRAKAEEAVKERDQARKAEESAKHEIEQARTARQATLATRDQALEEAAAARNAVQNTKLVLAFLKNNLLSAGHAMGWGGDKVKNLTMRQAADAAELKVAGAFADRPLVEASVRAALGSTYLDLGEAAMAVTQYKRALALREALLGFDDSETGDCRNKLSVALRLAGRTDEASRLFNQNPTSASHANALAIRGTLLLSQRKSVEAELKLRECVDIRQKIQPDDWSTFAAKAMLGEALLQQKKYADAEPLLLAGYEGLKKRADKIPPQGKIQIAKTLERLVQLYEVWGKQDEAAKWRKALDMVEAARKIREGSYLRILFTE